MKIDLQRFRLEKLEELQAILPLLSQQYDSFTTRWNSEIGTSLLISTIVSKFTPNNYFFSARKDGKLLFFIAVYSPHSLCFPTEAFVDYMHVDSSFRAFTKQLVAELLEYLRAEGFTSVKCGTCRMTRSYERWISKLGFKRQAILYKQELT